MGHSTHQRQSCDLRLFLFFCISGNSLLAWQPSDVTSHFLGRHKGRRVLIVYPLKFISMKWLLHLLLVSVFLRLSSQYQEIETLPTPEKYENSNWSSDAFRLPNGLKVLSKSVRKQRQSLLILDIKVGHSDCNTNDQQMSHLISEIISETLIEELNQMSYGDFALSHKGGKCTFFTHSNTSHGFAIKPKEFVATLRHFSRLFQTSSLFTEEVIEKMGKKAFDEFSEIVQEKDFKLLRVLQDKAIKNHSFYNYQRINEESAKNISVDSVSAFFNKYYVANNMTLTVITENITNEIKEIIAECFGSIPNKPIEYYFIGQPIFKEDTLGTISHFESTNESQLISFNWVLPIQYDKLADLEIYLKILLDSNAKGSLQQLLIKDGFITGLDMGSVQSNTFYWFEIDLHLTQKGLNEYKRVIQMFFSYLKFIQLEPIQTYLLEEELRIRKNRHFFNSFENQTFETLTDDTCALHWCPTENIYFSELQFSIDDDGRIKEFMNQFQPENSIVTLMSNEESPVGKDVTTSEDWEVKYWTEKIGLENIVDSTILFSFPTENTVIPDNLKERTPFNPLPSLDISPHPMFPSILWISPIDYLYKNSERISVLFGRDDFFMKSVENYSMITLLVRFFQRKLRYEFYYYERSGFEASINILNTGISFEFGGYKDKLVRFALNYIKRFFDFVSTCKYLQMFNCDISSYKLIDSFSKLTSIELVSAYLNKELLVTPYSQEDINKIFDSFNIEKINNILNEFTSKSYQLRIFITGSFSEFEANSFHFDIYRLFRKSILKKEWELIKGNQLIIEPKTIKRRTYTDDSSSNNAVGLYFQFPISKEDKRSIVFLHLYKKLFLSHFNKYFTKEEEISCAPDLLILTNRSFAGISFFVESKNFSCEEIEERILKFIEDALELLRGIFKPVFENEQLGEWITEISPNNNFGERIFASKIEDVKKEYQSQKTKKENYHSKHWKFITEQEIELTKEEFKEIASKIKLSEFIKFVDEHLQVNGSERRLMVISITGRNNQA